MESQVKKSETNLKEKEEERIRNKQKLEELEKECRDVEKQLKVRTA